MFQVRDSFTTRNKEIKIYNVFVCISICRQYINQQHWMFTVQISCYCCCFYSRFICSLDYQFQCMCMLFRSYDIRTHYSLLLVYVNLSLFFCFVFFFIVPIIYNTTTDILYEYMAYLKQKKNVAFTNFRN